MRNNIVLQREIEQSILNNKDIFTRRAKEILPFAVCRDRIVSKLCMLKIFTYEDLFEFVMGVRTKSWTPYGLRKELNQHVFTRQN